jgi:carbon monoxide dehydrogenase subunit G
MAHYAKTIEAPGSLQAIFDYLSDFSNVAEWDPGVREAERLDPGPLDVGSEFRVVAGFLGRDVELTYNVVKLEPPKRIVLEAAGDGLRSTDTISFEPVPKGVRITYRADLQLEGLRRLADPLLQVAFAWIGYDAIRGLCRRLDARIVGDGD